MSPVSADPELILDRVTDAIDALIESRDTHPTPLFSGILDRDTEAIPEEIPPPIEGSPYLGGQRQDSRAYPGSNLAHEAPLLRTLIALAEAGDDGTIDETRVAEYEDGALKYLDYFAKFCPDDITGLWPWGHHTFWHFEEGRPAKFQGWSGEKTAAYDGPIHHHWQQAPRWLLELLSIFSSDCVQDLADGLEYHWKLDTPNGIEYNRHAWIGTTDRYGNTGGDRSDDFPAESGYFIHTLAAAQADRKREDIIKQINRFSDYWWEKRVPEERGLLPLESRGNNWYSESLNTRGTLTLAASTFDAAHLLADVEPRLAERLRSRAETYADGFLAAPHDLKAGEFVFRTPRGDPMDIGDDTPRIYPASMDDVANSDAVHMTGTWQSFNKTRAGSPHEMALTCLRLYRHTDDERFRDVAVAAGETLLDVSLPVHESLRAAEAASGLLLLADLYAVTTNDRWLDAGLRLAGEVLDAYFDAARLPRGAPGVDHYESEMGTGLLLYGLTRLALLGRAGDDCPLPHRFDHTDALDHRY